MSISILNRGASGGLKPELTVTAPAGSTIDILRDGIIISTYTFNALETEHTFVVKIGTYTVRGTLGTSTSSVEVFIDAVAMYSVAIIYRHYLYEDGVNHVPFETYTKGTGVTVELKSTYFDVVTSFSGYNTKAFTGYMTQNAISMAPYNKLCVEVQLMSSAGVDRTYAGLYAMTTNTPTYDDPTHVFDMGVGLSWLGVVKIIEKDISTETRSLYLAAASRIYNYNTQERMRFTKIWLEQGGNTP